jgi:hypothetical protein
MEDRPYCSSCFGVVEDYDFSSFKPLTWTDVTSHLKTRLLMDDEWIHESLDQLDWWPWFLRQSFSVTERFDFDYDGFPDTALRVQFTTDLGRLLDPSEGFEIVAGLNRRFKVGSFVVINDRLIATGAVGFNSRNRSLLNLLHNNALIQAIVSHETALDLEADGRLELAIHSHPRSGSRTEKDELLSFFESEAFANRDRQLVDGLRKTVQLIQVRKYLDSGATQGFTADDVTFVNFDGFDVGIGWQDETLHSQRFGPGMDCSSTLIVCRDALPSEFLNDLNLLLHAGFNLGIGHFGSITQVNSSQFTSVNLSTFFAHSFLAQKGFDAFDSIVSATNAIAQNVASCRKLAEVLAAARGDSQ